ncbi:hypothetical protein, partial [Streptomyces europaeiscabiei]|uniref:hypothetical protein n=1 Tax=Streptomyces europaeiscabiei TaxID=146819 RepID=UPI0006284662
MTGPGPLPAKDAADAPPFGGGAAPAPAAAVGGRLPLDTPDFTGRVAELARLSSLAGLDAGAGAGAGAG